MTVGGKRVRRVGDGLRWLRDALADPRNRSLVLACALWIAVAGLLGRYLWNVRVWAPFDTALGHLNRSRLPVQRFLPGLFFVAVLLSLMAGHLGERVQARGRWARHLATGLFAAWLLYVFRDGVHTSGDSPNLLRDPVGALRTRGWYTFLDELVGMWLPLRLARWKMAQGTVPVDAILWSYRLVSIACGAAFCMLVGWFARTTRAPLVFCGLFVLNAALFHFAGYVENYQTATLLLTAGFLVAVRALREARLTWRHVLICNTCFTLAVACHGVAVWSVFSLVLLAILAARGSVLRWLGIAAVNVLLSAALLFGIYLLFSMWVTPGVSWVHFGKQGLLASWSAMMHNRPPGQHAFLLLRVATPALLILAAIAAVAPGAVWRAARRPDVWFAGLFLLGFLAHQLVWISKLGLERDWDLFGFTWLPLAYAAFRGLEETEPCRAAVMGTLALATLGGYSWTLSFARVAL